MKWPEVHEAYKVEELPKGRMYELRDKDGHLIKKGTYHDILHLARVYRIAYALGGPTPDNLHRAEVLSRTIKRGTKDLVEGILHHSNRKAPSFKEGEKITNYKKLFFVKGWFLVGRDGRSYCTACAMLLLRNMTVPYLFAWRFKKIPAWCDECGKKILPEVTNGQME